MRKIVSIILLLVFFAAVGYLGSKNKKDNSQDNIFPTNIPVTSLVEPTDFSTVVPTIDIPMPTPDNSIVISPGESAEVQCGEGNDGVRTQWQGKGDGYTSLNGQVKLKVKVLDANLQPAQGALVKWSLYDWGKLAIDGCNATFTAPDSIGLAYSSSATINTRVVTSPLPSPASGGGEGGPIFAGYSTSARITINSGQEPGCYDPAGVAISINSVPTTDPVQIVVDTPKFLGRVYNGRVATVRDGVGTYNIQIFVDGALYGETATNVAACQLATVKY